LWRAWVVLRGGTGGGDDGCAGRLAEEAEVTDAATGKADAVVRGGGAATASLAAAISAVARFGAGGSVVFTVAVIRSGAATGIVCDDRDATSVTGSVCTVMGATLAPSVGVSSGEPSSF
jgi:hypothetical protein